MSQVCSIFSQLLKLFPRAEFEPLLSKLDSRYGNLDSMQAESPWSVSRRWTPKPVKPESGVN